MRAMGEELKEQVEALKAKISLLELELKASQRSLIKETIAEVLKQKKKDNLKSEIMFKFRRTRQQIIKQKIMDTCSTKQVTVPELKFIIVDQLSYCSKASFYRYLNEMEEMLDTSGNYIRAVNQLENKIQ